MPGSFCVSITHSKDNTDKATVGFVVANAAVASDKDTMVFLSIEGVRLSQKGFADDIHETGFAPLKELWTTSSRPAERFTSVRPASRSVDWPKTSSSPERPL